MQYLLNQVLCTISHLQVKFQAGESLLLLFKPTRPNKSFHISFFTLLQMYETNDGTFVCVCAFVTYNLLPRESCGTVWSFRLQ